jgi:hypothetical protein
MTTSSDYFPSDAAGLPAARSPGVIELAHGDLFQPSHRAGGEAPRRRDRAHSGLQRLGSWPDAACAQASELVVKYDVFVETRGRAPSCRAAYGSARPLRALVRLRS